MDRSLFLILALGFVIHLIDTLAYSVRIAGIRTGRLAVSFSLFNLFVLVSRTANSFQSPLLAKRVERHILGATTGSLLPDLRLLLVAGSVATIVGAFMIPTFQNAFTKAVRAFNVHRSIPRLLVLSFSREGVAHLRESMRMPEARALTTLHTQTRLPLRVLLINTVAVAAWTVAVIAALYAGSLEPTLRVTAISMSALISGGATILLFVFSDPYLAGLTDDVMDGRVTESFFRRSVIWLVGSRLAGTVVAQILLVPAAGLIASVARHL